MSMPSPTEMAYQEQHMNDTRVPEMLVIFIFSMAIAHIAVFLRFMARRVKQQRLLLDDWVILASSIFSTAYIALMMTMTHFGYGHHAIVVKNPQILTLGLLVAEILYSISLALVKTSTLLLLHRVFPAPRLTPFLWAVGALITAYSLILAIAVMLQCIPIRALWDPMAAQNAHCIDIAAVFIVCSSLNAVTDLIMLALPMPFLWGLTMNVKRKLQITAIFACGGLVFAISIVRAPELVDVSPVDPSWSDVNGGIWSALESGVGTLCACLPTFGVLFTALKARSQRSSERRYDEHLDSESEVGLSGSAASVGVAKEGQVGKARIVSKDGEYGLELTELGRHGRI